MQDIKAQTPGKSNGSKGEEEGEQAEQAGSKVEKACHNNGLIQFI
jgi:hypothetical protein